MQRQEDDHEFIATGQQSYILRSEMKIQPTGVSGGHCLLCHTAETRTVDSEWTGEAGVQYQPGRDGKPSPWEGKDVGLVEALGYT